VDPGVGLASLLAIAGLIFGATNAFAHLQVALNIVWGVEPDRSMWRTLLRKRLLSFLMILVLVCLMVGLIAIGAFLSFLESSPIGVTLGPVAGVVFQGLHFAVTLALLTVFFAAVYAILPDVEVHWRRIWLSSAGAALLFALAMAALWLFLGFSRPGSAYGAAGNVAVVMLWIYLSTAILLFGAELTSVTYKSSASGER
jgi:membrane protein